MEKVTKNDLCPWFFGNRPKDDLKEPFRNHLKQIIGKDAHEATISMAFENLFLRYQNNLRVFHNIHHLDFIFQKINELIKSGKVLKDLNELPSLFLAIWYHDIIVEYSGLFSEAASCELFLKEMKAFYLPPYEYGIIIKAHEFIYATANHTSERDSHLLDLFLDIDCLVLASPEEDYEIYKKLLQQEVLGLTKGLSKNTFLIKRIDFLTDFYSRTKIFKTKEFEEFEEQARINMFREIRELGNVVQRGRK